MPKLPGIGDSDVAPILDNIGNHHHLGVSFKHGLGMIRRRFHLAETAAESDVLLRRELLAANSYDAAFEKDLLDFTKGRILDMVRQIEAENLRTQQRIGMANFKGRGCHSIPFAG